MNLEFRGLLGCTWRQQLSMQLVPVQLKFCRVEMCQLVDV